MVSTKTESELSLMRYAGKVAYETLNLMETLIHEGVTTKHLDIEAEKFIRSKNCTPSCLGYEGFPSSICASINDEVVHAIPSNRKLKSGDIITIDVGAIYKGYHGDAARTHLCGNVSAERRKLVEVTKQSFFEGIKQAKPNNRLSDISHAVQQYAESFGYGVVRDFTGHGIGTRMHEDPAIPNYGEPGHGLILRKGMTLAIEPMITAGTYKVRVLADDWTTITADHKDSAHYENTIVITDDGCEILTKLKENEN